MIAQRFRSIGWVASCAGAALICYLASQSVASERAALVRVDRQIASVSSEIKRLNTEIAARGRMGQIERWNTQVLALQAPAPGQFLKDEVQLASLAGGKPLPLDPAIVASKGATQTVAYQPNMPQTAATPAIAAPAPVAQPMLRPATFVRAKVPVLDASEQGGIVKASLVRTKPFELDLAVPDAAPAKAKVLVKAAPAEAKPKAAATKAKPASAKPALSASLLPSDLGTLIAAEKKGAKSSRVLAQR